MAAGGDFRGPEAGGTPCAASDGTSPPSACPDGPFGKGTGGELDYSVTVPAHDSTTLWVAAAGSDQGLSDAKSQLRGALADPQGELGDKMASRDALAANTVVSLPGDRLLQHAIQWGKQNLADLTQSASDLQIRWTNQGKQYPAPLGTVGEARAGSARAIPDYPWIFATDGEYTAFAGGGVGQFRRSRTTCARCATSPTSSTTARGIVVHETVSDGSVYFGHDSQTSPPTAPRPTTSTPTRRSSSPAPSP